VLLIEHLYIYLLLSFRLRRHSSVKHPLQAVRWIDTATGLTCDDTTRSAPAAQSQPSHASHQPLFAVKPKLHHGGTARKSTNRKSSSRALRVAMFNSGRYLPSKKPRLADDGMYTGFIIVL